MSQIILIGIVSWETAEGQMNIIKNKANKLGGNWVTLTSTRSGIAYKCPKSALDNG